MGDNHELARNTFIGIIVVGYAVRYATTETNQLNVAQIWGRFPKFLFGFLVVVLIVNLSGPSTTAVASIGTIRDWLFLLAFVGLGFDIDVDELRATGIRPVLLVLVHLVTVSVLTLSLVLSLF
ncbi:putative sulfate exporter family transporter [Halomicroarcula sp. GCM10025710]